MITVKRGLLAHVSAVSLVIAMSSAAIAADGGAGTVTHTESAAGSYAPGAPVTGGAATAATGNGYDGGAGGAAVEVTHTTGTVSINASVNSVTGGSATAGSAGAAGSANATTTATSNTGGDGGSGGDGARGGAGVLISGTGTVTFVGTATGGAGGAGATGGAGGSATSGVTDYGGDGGSGGSGGLGGSGIQVTGASTVTIGDGGTTATTLTGGARGAAGSGGAGGASADNAVLDGSSGSAGTIGDPGYGLDVSGAAVVNLNGATVQMAGYTNANSTFFAVVGATGSTLHLIGTNVINGGLGTAGTLDLGTTATTTVNGQVVVSSGILANTIGATQATSGQIDNGASTRAALFSNAELRPTVGAVGMANGERVVLITNAGDDATITNTAARTAVTPVAADSTYNTLVRHWSLGVGSASSGDDKFGTAIATSDTYLQIDVNTAAAVVGDLAHHEGAAFDTAANYNGTNAQLVALNHALQNLNTVAGVRHAAQQLNPEYNRVSEKAAEQSLGNVLGLVSARLDGVRASAAAAGVSTGEAERGLGVWAQGFGGVASKDASSTDTGYDLTNYGGAVGIDTALGDRVRIGVSVGYAVSNIDETGNRDGSTQDVKSYLGSLYGSYTGGPFYVDGVGSVGLHKYDSVRFVDIPGFAGGNANADFDGTQYGVKLETGYAMALPDTKLAVTPFASLSYDHLALDGYQETGGSGANQSVNSRDFDRLRSGLGVKLGTTLATGSDWQFNGSVKAAWMHDFLTDPVDTTGQYIASGQAFSVDSVSKSSDAAAIGIAVNLISGSNVSLTARYDGEFSSGFASHQGLAQVRVEF